MTAPQRENPIPLGSRHHVLWVDADPFQDLMLGRKRFEVRLNDRLYQRGDTLELRCDTWPHSRNLVKAVVGYVHGGLGMDRNGWGYVVLGLDEMAAESVDRSTP